jgi:hypothetical protein
LDWADPRARARLSPTHHYQARAPPELS